MIIYAVAFQSVDDEEACIGGSTWSTMLDAVEDFFAADSQDKPSVDFEYLFFTFDSSLLGIEDPLADRNLTTDAVDDWVWDNRKLMTRREVVFGQFSGAERRRINVMRGVPTPTK